MKYFSVLHAGRDTDKPGRRWGRVAGLPLVGSGRAVGGGRAVGSGRAERGRQGPWAQFMKNEGLAVVSLEIDSWGEIQQLLNYVKRYQF